MRNIIYIVSIASLLISGSLYANAKIPDAYVKTAQAHNISPILIYHIALCESGKQTSHGVQPWPWTLNIDGKGYYYQSYLDALKAAQSAINRKSSIDIGLMQINWYYHAQRFDQSLEKALNPYTNVAVGAQILNEYHKETGSWLAALGRYHSATPQKAKAYQTRCFEKFI